MPGERPCSPEWLTDTGGAPSDREDDILALARDALTLSLALVRDALKLRLRPPPTPDLLQGTRSELGKVALVMGPTGIRCAQVGQDKLGRGTHVRTLPHRGAHTPPSSYPGQPASLRRGDPAPPEGPRTRGEPVGHETGTGIVRAPTPPDETRGTPNARDKEPVWEPPGLARDGSR